MMQTRRTVVLSAGAAAAVAAAPALGMGDASPLETPMKAKKTFVLVHGAWHGGWCWRMVADNLRSAGHRVVTPTLTGMGARHHLATPDTDLNTHIKDVLNVLKFEELSNVVLVGHSYGGPVVEGVYDAAADQISKVVLLDASILDDGEAMLSRTPAELIDQTKATLIDGYMLPAWPPEAFGIFQKDGDVYAWLQRRLTSMPFKALTTPLVRANAPLMGEDTVFIGCNAPQMQGADANLDKANARGWTVKMLSAGHDAMVTAPNDLSALLMDAT